MLAFGLLAAALAAAPQVGDLAPDFTATDSDGKTVQLSSLLKDGPVILAFYPKAFSPGCTRELTAYRDRYAELTAQGASLVAVSMDDTATAKKLKESLKVPYPVIGDPRGKIAGAYQVQAPHAAFAQRYTFVIGKDRRVLHVQSGADAIDPSGSIQACLPPKAPPAPDAGRR